ncbi:MAG TPA: hypothetical protein VFE47_27155 [Tepidisphaeraceae bacterium]|jgi:hypothetical protein|nr:hypothetical protein [Tepidisphaeraceae bacterium]
MDDTPAHPPILVLGCSEAAMKLRQPGHEIAAVLSIHSQGEYPVDATGIALVQVLQFDDIERAECGRCGKSAPQLDTQEMEQGNGPTHGCAEYG